MLIQESSKKRSVNINFSYKEHLDLIKRELVFLFQGNHLAKDIKFLRKMAINIKQLHFDARIAKHLEEFKHHAKAVDHFLSTPIGAPFVGKITLTKAAETFSEQDPQDSDLSHLLMDFAKYGKSYATQLLRVFILKQNACN